MNYPTVRRVHSAFTLIELLVVVAIIALLSAILFPVFGQVRDKARASACMSNAKQIGLAMLQYTVDNDEKYPSGNESSLGAIDGSGWYSNIRPYLKEEGAVVCPSDPTVTANSTNQSLSFGYNLGIFTNLNLVQNTNSPVSGFTSPSKTVLLFEVTNSWADQANNAERQDCTAFGNFHLLGNGPNPNIYSWSSDPTQTTAQCVPDTGLMGGPWTVTANIGAHVAATASAWTITGYSYQLTGRHQGGSNFIMADGHAKWFPPGSVSPGASARFGPNDAAWSQRFDWSGDYVPTAAGTSVSTWAATFSKI